MAAQNLQFMSSVWYGMFIEQLEGDVELNAVQFVLNNDDCPFAAEWLIKEHKSRMDKNKKVLVH